MIIKKKVQPSFFKNFYEGKNYEFRSGNFDCKPGDMLVIKEWNPQTKEYT